MSRKLKSAKEKREESHIRALAKVLQRNGVELRRENLARGPAFKVKSGGCLLLGKTHLFVDRRLPLNQQVSVLLDFVVDSRLDVYQDDLGNLPSQAQSLLNAQSGSFQQ